MSDTTSAVSVSSNPVSQLCYTTLCMTLHTMYMTSLSVCMTSHEHFMTSHPYRYDIIASIFMTSYAILMISPILFHENKMMLPVISPTVFDNTATASVWSHPFHQWLHNNYGNLHTWHTLTSYTYYITSNSDFMTSVVSIWDITSTEFTTSDLLYMTSHPWFMTSHPLYLWHHSNYISNITPTMFVNIYQLYLTWNTLC